jgi:hypothetical protein
MNLHRQTCRGISATASVLITSRNDLAHRRAGVGCPPWRPAPPRRCRRHRLPPEVEIQHHQTTECQHAMPDYGYGVISAGCDHGLINGSPAADCPRSTSLA